MIGERRSDFMQKTGVAYIASWEEAFQLGVNEVGGKGWNLSRLARYGFRIPVGFVLTTTAYRHFVGYNQLKDPLGRVSHQVTLDNLSEDENILSCLREQITNAAIPPAVVEAIQARLAAEGLSNKAVAVRSSASAEDSGQSSFAGIHDTFLNVNGLDNIMDAIKGCYASLWTPRAIAYRRKMNLTDLDLRPAVVIMEMVDAQASGVAFSCDPQSGRRDVLVINANFGLGESVVSGAIEPDTYCLTPNVFKAVPEIKSKQLGSKQGLTRNRAGGEVYLEICGDRSNEQALNDENIKNLGTLINRVFDALGDGEQHQDIEWAFDGQELYLLQARPVTALPDYSLEAIKNQASVWSNCNYRDAIPMVLSPLHRRIMKDIIDIIQFSVFSAPGYPMPEGFQFSRFYNGRLYCNMTNLYWAYYDCHGLPPETVTFTFGGHQPEMLIDDPDPFQGEAGLRRQKTAMQNVALMAEAGASASQTIAETIAAIEELTGNGFEDLPDLEFTERFESLGRIIMPYSEKYPFLGAAGGAGLGMLMQNLYQKVGSRATSVINGLMAGGETAITSADQGYRLVELAEQARQDKDALQYLTADKFDPLAWESQLPENSPFKQSFRDFLKEFGHRAIYELDIINPRWQEDPTYLLDIIRSTITTADMAGWRARQAETFNQAWEEIAALFPTEQYEEIRKTIKDSQRGSSLREMGKSVLALALQPYRLMALELGKRFFQKGLINKQTDIFFCTWTEIFSVINGAWNGLELKALVEDRIANHLKNEKLMPPDVIQGGTPIFSEPIVNPSGNYLQGIATAAGKATGVARLINHPREGYKLQAGEVLVAPSTDPGWTPLFLKACALVMETGGYVSHGSIVAREYGIPAVINVPGIMKAVQDGQTITVDGDEGRIYLS
jgi:phosphohistidine swiveling domain-containing protein